MTDLDLFPRGKTPSGADATPGSGAGKPKPGSSGGRDQGKGSKKRKAVESPAPGASKDWLFGSPQESQQSAAGKRSKDAGDSGASGRRASGGKGKPGSAAREVGSGMLIEHSGRAPRLEMVSFKKLNKGTLALGIVFKINEHDMVVSLPSSLTGVVRRKEVSDHFHLKAAAMGGKRPRGKAGGRGRYFDEGAADDSPLTELFKEGQVVRCYILSVAKEAGGRHIELSLRASVLNKGLALPQLAKGCGVYGSVVSAEDHGYVVTLGLDGVTAFLPTKDAPEDGLKVGQPVEAVIQTVKAAARTVTLSTESSLVAAAVTKGTSFDLRSLKPGMLVDTIVDSVLANGMLVSFLGYFAGCVDHNNMPVVSGDTKDEDGGWRSLYRPGPEPVRARILLVDYANKAIRLTLRPHLVDMKPPSGLPPTGALLDGEVVRVDPALGLLLRVPSTDSGPACPPTGNAPSAKKEKGQGRRDRRAKAAAAAAAGVEEGGSEGVGSVGAYVHISRISDERTEHVEKTFKAGQKVRCRVTGSSLVEGWSAASLRASVLSAAVLRYQDLKPGAAVEGEVAAVEAFGLLVKLGEGVRALVPKNHLGDATVKNPKARFKVGARVKGRVLTVDAPSSKATLTLKRSMTKDKRTPITSYDEAERGAACTGFVTKVAPFGLHVSFYGNVFGVLPSKALARHGIEEASEAFAPGQVVGCVVRSRDLTCYPPKLSLALDVAGKTERLDGDANSADKDGMDDSDDDVAAAAECPLSPGDVVKGVVSATQSTEGAVTIDLSVTSPDATTSTKKKKKSKKGSAAAAAQKTVTLKGVLPHAHLGDHNASPASAETLAARLAPGTAIEKLLVLDVDKHGVPVVSLKPLLLAAAAASQKVKGAVTAAGADASGAAGGEDDPAGVSPGSKGAQVAFIPAAASDLSVGDLVAGFVSRVESFGVFVRFLGRFAALCPRSMAADRAVEDPRGMFEEGDSVRCVVQRIDEDTSRVVVTLSRAAVPPSAGNYLRSLLSQAFAAATNTTTPAAESDAGDDNATESPWGRVEFGATANAVVVAVKEYGVVLKAVASKGGGGKEGQLMVCALEHAMDGVEEGNEVKVRVLGMDMSKGVVDVTMDTALVKAGRSKRRKAMAPLDAGETVSATVVLAKPDAKWAVASSSNGRLLLVQVADFHAPHRTCRDAGLCPETPTEDAAVKELEVRVGDVSSPGEEGYWGSVEGAGGPGSGNPYAGAVVVVSEEGAGAGKKKTSRRRSRGESLDLGDKSEDGGANSMLGPMKARKVSLGNIKKGTEVVCEVISVHWDRLDVKVAVRYPKAYGPRADKGHQLENEEMEAEDQDEAPAPLVPTRKANNKRPRPGAKANAEPAAAKSGEGNKLPDRKNKNIVRIRGKVHCTAVGTPVVDAPSRKGGQEEDGGGDDAATMPDWHPLKKYHIGQVLQTRVLHCEDMPQKRGSNLLFRLLELGSVRILDDGVDNELPEEEAAAPERDVVWWGERSPQRGEVHRGVITEVTQHGVQVSLSTSVRGLVPPQHLSNDPDVVEEFRSLFRRGVGVRVLVRNVDGERKRLILSLVGVPTPEVLPDSALPAISPGFNAAETIEEAGDDCAGPPVPGDVVEGTVDLGSRAWAPPCLMVRLDGGAMGRVCVTEVAEEGDWRTNPVARFKDGQRVKCRVLPPLPSRDRASKSPSKVGGGSEGPLEVSLRPSRLDLKADAKKAIKRERCPKIGATAKCYVVTTCKSGCFVRLAGGVSGRVMLKLLSDRYVSNPDKEFPPGRLVAGKVLSKDEATGHVSLTLQPSAVLDGKGGEGGGLSWGSKSLSKGLKVKGMVAAVKDFGVFIQIQDSEVRGMCHRSEAAEGLITDLTQVYEEGDLVKAMVLKVDRSKKRLSLGLKPSYFEGDADTSDDEDKDDHGMDVSDGSSSDGSQSDGDDDDGEDEGPEGAKAVTAMDASDSEEEQVVSEEEQSDGEEGRRRNAKRQRAGVLEGGLVGASGGANAFSLNFGALGSMGGAGASSDEDDDSDDDSDGGAAAGGKGHRSRKKAKERREEEDRIVAREKALQDEDAVPETVGDYERLIVAAPNESLLWVKFMAFKLSLADVEGARSVGERGLKAVSFRMEQERFNLWVSLINLEHKFGSRATLKAVSERACQNSDPKRVYLHMAEMHEKAQETEECEEVFQAATKKFRHSKKVWVLYQLSRLKRGDDVGAREVLQRSLQSLSRHKHVDVISRFAQSEFEHGSVERGRSVFEGMMASYPKRLDLWNVYLDKEVKGGDMRAARNLLERMTAMDFNSKRMKGVFKKYLQFEMDHGDEAGVDAVKAKATEYVASLPG